MKIDSPETDDYTNLVSNIHQRQLQEHLAQAPVVSEILSKLNVVIEDLPQKCQQLLVQAANHQASLGLDQLDSISISLQHSKNVSERLTQEYQILKLTQKNADLQAKIDRNKTALEELRNDLDCSRDSLMTQTPNPDSIQDRIRQLRLKVASYEENCEKAKAKYTKLSVPDGILPVSLTALASTLASLLEEMASLRERADDVALAREARETFNRLRRN